MIHRWVLLVAMFLPGCAATFADEQVSPPPAGVKTNDLPQGDKGIAARYTGDEGISSDPAVVFHDDFEADQLGKSWDQVKTRGTSKTPAVETETAPAFVRGARSARVALSKGGWEDITLYKRLVPSRDEIYMRHYVRYGRDYGYHGHGGSGFCGSAQPQGFGPGGSAGRAPKGDSSFWGTLEPIGRIGREWKPPGALIFYAYWWKMKPDGKGKHWGNWFRPEPDHVPPLETWICLEWRVKVNTPEREDGELDCWIDGIKCGEFRGINWRSTESLKLNQIWLSLWLEDGSYEKAGGGTTRTVWYDDVVVATTYIGPKTPSRTSKPGR